MFPRVKCRAIVKDMLETGNFRWDNDIPALPEAPTEMPKKDEEQRSLAKRNVEFDHLPATAGTGSIAAKEQESLIQKWIENWGKVPINEMKRLIYGTSSSIDPRKPVQHRPTFIQIGKMASSAQIGHLTIDFSLQNLTETVRDLEGKLIKMETDHYEEWKVLFPEKKHDFVNSSLTTLKRAEKVVVDMDVLFKASVFVTNPDPRDKRQIALIAAGIGLVASVGMSGLSLYESVQSNHHIQNISSRINVVSETIKHDETEIAKDHSAIFKVQQALKDSITDLAKTVEKQELLAAKHMADQAATLIFDSIQNWASNLRLLLNHRLPPGLLDMEKMRKSFEAMEVKAKQEGLHPIEHGFEQLFRQEIAVYRIGKDLGDIRVQVFVPYARHPLMQLYRYHRMPMNIMDGMALVVSSDKNYLALKEDETLLRTLTESEFSQCKEKGKVYFCLENKVIDKNNQESCLYNLYKGRTRKINETCPFSLTRGGEFVQRIQHNVFEISAPKETVVSITCHNDTVSTSEERRLSPIDTFSLDEGCSAVTPNHFVRVERTLHEKIEITAPVIHLNLGHILPGLSVNELQSLNSSFQVFDNEEIPLQIASVWSKVHLDYEDPFLSAFPSLSNVFGLVGSKIMMYVVVPLIVLFSVFIFIYCGGISMIKSMFTRCFSDCCKRKNNARTDEPGTGDERVVGSPTRWRRPNFNRARNIFRREPRTPVTTVVENSYRKASNATLNYPPLPHPAPPSRAPSTTLSEWYNSSQASAPAQSEPEYVEEEELRNLARRLNSLRSRTRSSTRSSAPSASSSRYTTRVACDELIDLPEVHEL